MSKNILNSITTVADILRKNHGTTRFFSNNLSTMTSSGPKKEAVLTALRKVSLLVANQYEEITFPIEPLNHLFSNLGISRSEEIHSNSIAACFNSSQSTIGLALLSNFMVALNIPMNLAVGPLKISRERRLGSLPWSRHLDSEIQARRLDILVEHHEVVLAIENKVDSSESDNQTADYYIALNKAFGAQKKVICVYLTPDRELPENQNFYPLSYPEFFSILRRTLEPFDKNENTFAHLYLKQLFDIFIGPREATHKKTVEYWKGKNL